MFEDGSAPLSFRIKDNANFRDGSIKVTITCRAEDIEITEIEFKEKYKEHLPLGFGEAKKKKLARILIQEKLAEAGLEVGNLKESYAHVILADVIAAPENG